MKRLYKNLQQMQSFKQVKLEILWTQRKWVNPFIPPAIFWHGRECYPVRLNTTQRGQNMLNHYKEAR